MGARSYRRRLPVLLLYLGFLTTGAMTVLLGVVLPKLAAAYHLDDRQTGTLLMLLFGGSSTGALFVRRNFERTLTRGYLLIPAAAALLLLAPRWLGPPAIVLFGLGLGLAMTSTSMLVGRIFPRRRGAALSFLNFAWSIGATLCPLLIARVHSHLSIPDLALLVGLVAAPFAALPLASRFEAPVQAISRPRPLEAPASLVVLFAVLGFLYVGVETSIGSWMTTFALRAVSSSTSGSWTFGRSSLATACFWAALLAGRGLAPAVLCRISEYRLFRLAVGSLLAGILLLTTAHQPALLLAGAIWTGLSLAPIYPLVIALFMARAGESKSTGWVFSISGFGGALLPWLTGWLSLTAHSLRIGLVVPTVAAGLLLVLVFCLAPESKSEARPEACPQISPEVRPEIIPKMNPDHPIQRCAGASAIPAQVEAWGFSPTER
jgi:MFS transporter, FHS family, glucose/mannose:H+ symporter